MPNRRLMRIEKQLKEALGIGRLEADARRSRFERRTSRVIKPVMFLTSLLHSLGTRRVESLADLHRDFNAELFDSVRQGLTTLRQVLVDAFAFLTQRQAL